MPTSMKLTAHQAKVIELKARPGMNWGMIAKEMDCGVSSVISSHKLALKKLARQANGDKVSPRSVSAPVDPGAPSRTLKAYMKSVDRVTDKSIGDGLDKAIAAIQYQLSLPEVVATASFRDLSSSLGILIDRRQLLKGEPTAITRFQDIRKLDEVAEMLNAELKRRGKLIDAVAEEV